MTKKIYLIRHAQSEANIAADLDNPTYYYDAPITKVGKKQALNAKEQLTGIATERVKLIFNEAGLAHQIKLLRTGFALIFVYCHITTSFQTRSKSRLQPGRLPILLWVHGMEMLTHNPNQCCGRNILRTGLHHVHHRFPS